MHPVAIIIKYRNITHLEPHPTSNLIKYIFICNKVLYKHKVRTNDSYYFDYKHKNKISNLIFNRNLDAYHDGILLKSELQRLKNKV